MLIDWFTVGAQALNFLVLVWLMKRFLYKPILQAIEAREKLIASELADAAAKKSNAQKEQEQFQSKNKTFDLERSALLTEATDKAKVESQTLIDEARKAADTLREKRMGSLEIEARDLSQSITDRAQGEVLAISRKVLSDLASSSLEEQISTVFIGRLKTLDDKAKERFGEALKSGTTPALVRSTFDLTEEQRAIIQKTLNETFSADIYMRFETTPDLVCGIELTSNGQKLEWSIANYLTLMEKSIAELLNKLPKKQDSEHAA